MKSLSLSTPLVRTKMSKGGSPAVYMWFVIISAVMVSGSGRFAGLDKLRADGDSGWCSVAEEETESSTPTSAGDGGVDEASSMDGRSGFDMFLTLMFWEMRV